jgi:tetratricopeptide (TPR) repeat protein
MRHAAPFALLLLSMLVPGGACRATVAETSNALFQEGNAHYQNGDYAAAESCYLRLLDLGMTGSSVYYNLGNTCFKQKKLGEAIYYWEKARRLAPGDADIRQNLALAGSLVVDRIEVPEDPFPLRLAMSVLNLFTVTQESWIVLALFLLGNGLVAVYLLAQKPRLAFRALTAALAAGVIMLLFAGSLAWKVYRDNHRKDGVIVEQKVDVRSGPGLENITVVSVHEGILLHVRDESDGWYLITLPNGWNGWLPKSSI